MHLNELIRDKFAIYTRSQEVYATYNSSLNILRKYANDSSNYLTVMLQDPHAVEYQFVPAIPGEEWSIFHISEVHNLLSTAFQSKLTSSGDNSMNLLHNKTTLLPVSKSFLQDVINQVEIVQEQSGSDLEQKFYKRFFENELTALQGYLKKCGKSAVVLPTYLGYKFVKQLEANGYNNVYQGGEKYYELNIAFEMTGVFPRYLVLRAKHAEICGIWKHWQRLFKEKYVRKHAKVSDPPRKPTMKGNIIVIFLLLGSGMVISIASICFEMSSLNFPLEVL